MIDPNDEAQIELVAREIADREFGVDAGHYDRLRQRAEAWPGCYSHSKLVRLWSAARAVLTALRDNQPVVP